ncbi:MAG TPA: hypothetical protein ENJ31_12710 [Anaerolineae bacterium]|nr:hypothetical protein [Anaerolineae bacterium]
MLSQQQLAAWFEVAQPHISRWEKYWPERDWANLLNQRYGEVLTVELRAKIVDVLARFPWKGQQWVWAYLQEQRVVVSRSQVRQAAEDSGWARFKTTLRVFQ